MVIICIFADHLRKSELAANLRAHRHADKAARMRCHEIYIFRCCKFRSADAVAFIFSVGIISHQNNLARPQGGKTIFYRIKITFHYLCIIPKNGRNAAVSRPPKAEKL